MFRRRWWSIAVYLGLLCVESLAQQSVNSANLTGLVQDGTGSVIAAVRMKAVNLERNQEWVATTDSQGKYHFLYIPVGQYQLRAEKAGFHTVERTITLTIGQSLDIPIRLTVEGITEQVNVTSELPLLESTRSELSETILPREVDSLPLNGRNYLELAALTPGVSRGNPVGNQRFAETSAVPGTQISVAGQRNINNNFIIDGVSGNDDAADLPGTFFSQEVIREFQVIASGGVAEFGRASSGIVNVVTQSGGNAWHGRFLWLSPQSEAGCSKSARANERPTDTDSVWCDFRGPDCSWKDIRFWQFRADKAEQLGCSHNPACQCSSHQHCSRSDRLLERTYCYGYCANRLRLNKRSRKTRS